MTDIALEQELRIRSMMFDHPREDSREDWSIVLPKQKPNCNRDHRNEDTNGDGPEAFAGSTRLAWVQKVRTRKQSS